MSLPQLRIKLIKRPDMFRFRNPGNMRIPLEQALQGGQSNCRNRTLHQLFLMIGIGERAGSGIETILNGWKLGNWRPPSLQEKDEPEQTILELRMLDLLPRPVLDLLHRWFGDPYKSLTALQRLILATAFIETVVSHSRLKEITTVHPSDLTKALQELVRKGFLEAVGRGRSTQYHLFGAALTSPDDVFTNDVPNSSGDLSASSEHLNVSQRDTHGRWITSHLSYPAVDNLKALTPEFLQTLELIAHLARNKRHVRREQMQQTIIALCKNQYVTLHVLAQLLNRSPDALRQQYLSLMVRSGYLKMAFPHTPTHEKQAYIAATSQPNA